MSTPNNRRNWLRWAGLIIGLVWAAGYTYIVLFAQWPFFRGALVAAKDVGPLAVILGLIACPFFFISLDFAWKWGLAGGILLIIQGSIPAGILFILLWREERKLAATETDESTPPPPPPPSPPSLPQP